MINDKNYSVGLYIRLSREDENKTDVSESITNQKSLLLQYVKENNLRVYDIYIDDGYSGTTFDRPGFNRLINDIENKLVKQNDNYFEGNIEVKNDSYLKITIPYDQGFRIFVDDKESQIEMIDNAFMGVKLNSGNHKIIIKFTPPYLKEGIIFTVIGLLLLMLMFIKDKKILKK